jgi:membrane protease YdiL (CAAX protease family)
MKEIARNEQSTRHSVLAGQVNAQRSQFQDKLFTLALLLAIFLFPLIGGIRGVAIYAGWFAFPLIAAWQQRSGSAFGLNWPPGFLRFAGIALTSAILGVTCAALLLKFNTRVPVVQFVYMLPYLHKSVVGNSFVFFLALIPVAHTAHELFFRGYLQSELSRRLTPWAGLGLATLLFAWTHVLIFSSDECRHILQAIDPTLPGLHVSESELLRSVLGFAGLESVIAGALLMATRTVVSGIIFRASNLIMIALILHHRLG